MGSIAVFTQSSIRITGNKTIYLDPFQMKDAPHDADMILITHDHYDHFSPEDIARVSSDFSILIVPERMREQARAIVPEEGRLITVTPGTVREFDGMMIGTVPAYNTSRSYHPKRSGWVGYLLNIDGTRIYAAGDTDITKEAKAVSCDIALVPVGGTYTMDALKAADLINTIRPETAVPIHYGSIVGSPEDADIFREHVNKNIKVKVLMGGTGTLTF